MAVNENDRVSTRRLKEFWQTAKTWIQNLVSGAIATSEETMRSTMDTKIRAAKPNYNMPNTNDQIGVGYGYNETYKANISIQQANQTYYSVVDLLNSISGTSGMTGLAYWAARSLLQFYDNVSINNAGASSGINGKNLFKKVFMQLFEGSLFIRPIEAYNDNNFEIKPEYYYCKYNPDEISLTTPIIPYDGHNYQMKLKTSGQDNANLLLYEKVDDGDFTLVNWTHSSFNFIIKLNTMITLGFGYIKDKAVSLEKLSDSAYNRMVFRTDITRRYYDVVDGEGITLYPTEKWITYYSKYSNNSTYHYLLGIYMEGYKRGIFGHTYASINQLSPSASSTNYAGQFDNTNKEMRFNLSSLTNINSSYWKQPPVDSSDYTSKKYCLLAVKNNSGWHNFFGKITQNTSSPNGLIITPLDDEFFNEFVNDDDYLIIQTLYQPMHYYTSTP